MPKAGKQYSNNQIGGSDDFQYGDAFVVRPTSLFCKGAETSERFIDWMCYPFFKEIFTLIILTGFHAGWE
jgi:hypothetical protein